MKAADMLGDALQLASDHPKVLVPWVVIVVLSGVVQIASGGAGGSTEGMGVLALALYAIAVLVLIAWASAVTVILVRAVKGGEIPHLASAAKDGLGKTPSVVFLSIALAFVIVVAAGVPALLAWLVFRNVVVLLVLALIAVAVWAVFLGVKLGLSEAALVVDELGIGDAFSEAWEASRELFWSLLGLFLILGIVAFVLELLGEIPYVGVFLTTLGTPFLIYWGTAAAALAYLHVQDDVSTEVGGRDLKTPPRVAPWDERSAGR